MTDLTTAWDGVSGTSAQLADRAVAAADAAASAASVLMREVSEVDELQAICNLYDTIWRPGANPPVTAELLRAFSKAGNYVAAAFDQTGMVGACVGFFSDPAEDYCLHSHIAGVAAISRGRQIGFTLKAHQRAWALLRGVPTISWTFDPLVSRNAWFNLGKLAATPTEYLVNFYGGMRDGINGADDSDRLLVRWPLTAEVTAAACEGQPIVVSADAARTTGAVTGLSVDANGGPRSGSLQGNPILLAIPRDIESLRRNNAVLAATWRRALRDSLGTLLADGARVTGFDRAGWYVLERGTGETGLIR